MMGRIAYVMGPSGAGKDTLLRMARDQLAGTRIAFAHRYITRPPSPGDEEFVPLAPAEFAARRAASFFAMDWKVRGVRYGIGIEIETWQCAGWLVVVSGSREHFNAALRGRSDINPILITARPEILARRLAARGRDDAEAVAVRLARAIVPAASVHPLTTIDNSGGVQDSAVRLIAALRALQPDIASQS